MGALSTTVNPMSTRKGYLAAASLLLASIGIAGCEDGRERGPKVGVRVVHAAPTTSEITFRREGREEASLGYGQASGELLFDADQYDFNVDVAETASGGVERRATFSETLAGDNEYLFVLTEVAGLVQPIVLEKPAFDSTTDTEITALHAGTTLGAMDVYLEPPDADLTTATPLGAIAFGEALDTSTRPSGDYRLTLTESGAAGNVLLSSPAVTLAAGASVAFVVVDGTADSTTPLVVVPVGAGSGFLADTSTGSTFQVVNAAADMAARDVFVDEDFTSAPIAELEFGALSTVEPIAPGAKVFSVTPAGNPGVVEVEHELSATRGSPYTLLIAGEPGELSIASATTQGRIIAGIARLRFMNGASQVSPLAFYLVPPETDVTNLSPLVSLDAPGISQRMGATLHEYDLVFRDADTGAIVGGPERLTLTKEGAFTILAVNGSTPGTVDFVLLDESE